MQPPFAGLALLLCAAHPAGADDEHLPPLVLVDERGGELLRDDWTHFGDGFHAVLFADAARLGEYDEDEVELSARLSRWLEIEPGALEVIEVYVVPADEEATAHRYGPTHRRIAIHAAHNAAVVEQWMPAPSGRLTLVGPAGRRLGTWDANDRIRWEDAERVLRTRLEQWLGPPLGQMWADVVGATVVWRRAFDRVVSWRRRPPAAEVAALLEPLLETKPRAADADEAAVRVAALLCLAARAAEPLPERLAKDVERSRLVGDRPRLALAAGWYRASRAKDPAPVLAELLPRRDDERARTLVDLRALRLRSASVATTLVGWLAQTRPADQELRSQALRYLAELRAPGERLANEDAGADVPLPRPPGIDGDEHWETRLAYAEALGGYASREAVALLIAALDGEQHPRVKDALVGSLAGLTGLTLQDAAVWRAWLAERSERWKPGKPAPIPFRPRSVSDIGRYVDPKVSFFGTELDHVLFLVDVSESMRDGFEDEVERNLALELESMDEDVRVGLTLFSAEPRHRETKPALRPATERVKKDLLRFYEAEPKQGLTDYAAALAAAFEYEDLEQVVLVTDGFVTEGTERTNAELVELVDRLNALRRVRIDTLLLLEGRRYFFDEVPGDEVPAPTADERKKWAAATEGLELRPDVSLLHALAGYHDGRCRIAFANQLYARTGLPSDDR